jgi:glycosyltransferase involved in cell wall biosynthesis
MKIAFFCASTTFSGGRQAMFRHAGELARRGHEVSLWAQGSRPRVDWMDLALPLSGFAIRSLPQCPRADVCVFDRVRLAWPLWLAGRGKVVHFCQGFEGIDAELRMRSVRARRGIVLGLPKLCKLWWRHRAIDRAYQLPTAKVVTHQHLGSLILRRFGQPSYFVPYGLPAGVFTPLACRPKEGRTVLIVGPTDVGWKRVTDALAAVRLLKQRKPDVRLIRVAQHPMRDVERSLAVTDEYHSMLTPPEMASLYRRADVLLLASDATEGFGLPLLEAMACGLPCVVTDIPAFRTFARPDDYAHFAEVGDVQGMAAAVERLLDSPAERERLGARGLEVAAGYTMRRSCDAMEETLTAIAAGGEERLEFSRPSAA